MEETMETQKPKLNNSTEPVSQEDNLVLARTMLEKGASIDAVMASSGLNRERVLGIKSGIARRSKRFNARSNSTEPKTEPQIQIQAENKPQENKTIPFSGAVKVPPKLWDELDELDKKNLKGWKANVLTWNEMEKEQVQRNDGHGVPSYGSGDDDLKRAKARLYESMAETEEMERLEDLKQRRNEKHTKTETKENPYEKFFLELIAKTIINNKGEQLGMKDTLELAKFLGGSNIKETIQLVDYITQARNQGQNVTLNDIALKLEEMKQNAALEDKKLSWEMAKWERQEAKGDQTVELIKEGLKTVSGGAVGDFVRGLGGAAADRIRGVPKAPQIVDVTCPACSRVFKADGSARVLICGFCGAQLQKQGSQPQPNPIPQPEPESNPQPSAETPQTETPQAQPQETLSEPKKHPDVLTDF
jgi:hypothetical protein